jgi:integrase/recombinase XerD
MTSAAWWLQVFLFTLKNVLKRPYDLPSKLYPRKKFRLPNVMTTDEVWQLLSNTGSIKQKAIVQLFYSSGVRLEEFSRIRIADIDSRNMRIKVVQGKGKKDRYTLLSVHALTTLCESIFASIVLSLICLKGRSKARVCIAGA